MVYIEERISKLEEAVESLKGRLQEVHAEVKDKKRKADVVDREELRAALAQKADVDRIQELQKKVDKDLKDVIKMDFFDKTLKELKEAVARGETSRQATVTDDRITKAIEETHNNTSKALSDLSAQLAQKVSQEELTTNVQNVHTALQQQVQSAVQSSQQMMATVSQQAEQMKHISNVATAQAWKDVDAATDTTPFDVNKLYRIRIGEGQSARWLYSTEVSMGQVYLVDTILDQGMVVNSTSKGSYGARRLGQGIETTKYYAVFQMQARAF